MTLATSDIAFASAGVALLFVLKQTVARKSTSSLPPGPATLPVIGNLLDLTREKGWLAPVLFRNWGREFGSDIVRANLFGQDIIVVNSQQAADELFEQRSNIYSERPQMSALRKLLGFDWLALFMPSGQQLTDMRTAFETYFRPSEYRGIEAKAAHNLLRMLKGVPEDFMQHFQDVTGATSLAVAYGIEALPQDDFLVATAQKAMAGLNHGTSADALAFDSIPQLFDAPAMLPGGKFKQEAEAFVPAIQDSVEFPMNHVKIHSRTGKARPSVALNMRADAKAQNSDAAKQVPANIHFMNANTISSALSSFILAMLRNPEAQRTAQAEIDAIVGPNRLPEFDDAEFLPYIDAIVKEVLRWRPVAPMSVPHAAQEDDTFRNFFIPKGSIVLGNSWAVLHDERVYPKPDQFKPERWLNKPNAFPDAAFGFGGSRSCPGQKFARDQLWITIASMLATFDIKKPVDEAGWTMQPEAGVTYSSTLFSHPSPFECQITPRSAAAARLVDQTACEGELTA